MSTSQGGSSMRLISDDDSRYYQVQKKLGEGSYGRVYQVLRLPSGPLMACKVQTVSDSYQDWATKRELRVWRSACNGSKYVVRVYDASYNQSTREVRIYSELLEGGDLYRMLKTIVTSGGVPYLHPLILYHVSLQLAWALAEIQARSILHRDIKTDNVLMTMKISPGMNKALWRLGDGGTLDKTDEVAFLAYCETLSSKDDRLCVLTDFGLSRDMRDPERSSYTMGAGARWTVGTSAPELFYYNVQTPMADIFSVGVLINTLATGQGAPPAGEAFPALPSCYDRDLQRLVDQCLEWEPAARPTAGDMVRRLWDLKMRETKRVNDQYSRHQQKQQQKREEYRRYMEWYANEQRRQKEIEERARERDRQAAEDRQRALAEWKNRREIPVTTAAYQDARHRYREGMAKRRPAPQVGVTYVDPRAAAAAIAAAAPPPAPVYRRGHVEMPQPQVQAAAAAGPAYRRGHVEMPQAAPAARRAPSPEYDRRAAAEPAYRRGHVEMPAAPPAAAAGGAAPPRAERIAVRREDPADRARAERVAYQREAEAARQRADAERQRAEAERQVRRAREQVESARAEAERYARQARKEADRARATAERDAYGYRRY